VKTLALLLALSSAAAAQVTGTVRYEDRTYDGSGFTGTAMRPVRQAEFDLLRSSDGTLLASGVTDNSGSFSIAGLPPSEVIRLRIYARRSGGQINAIVRTNQAANALYAATTAPLDTSVTTAFGTVDILISGGAAPAFNIFDCAVKTFQYLATLQPTLPAIPPILSVYWEAGTTNGTYFERTLNSVFLLGSSSDPDEYDDDIILHEMGHWVAFNFSKDDTLGGSHTIIDQLDPRTSWSEGWAHYWSGAVRLWVGAEYVAPNLQVDNFGVGHSVFDLEAPSFPTQTIMATNEVAVGSILWHIPEAAAGTPGDLRTDRELEIWKSVSVRIPAQTQISLEDFHDGLALEAPAIMPGVTGSETTAGIFKGRLVRYYPDGSEPNNSPGAAALLPLGPAGLALRTFYPAGNEDWYSVAATPGTLVVETLNLGDGADTVLELYDSAGVTLIGRNDNRTPTDRSSLVTQVVTVPTTFLVRVLGTGGILEYGYYDVRAQIVVNAPPVITGLGTSATSGTAPLRVTFSASMSDPDGGSHEYQWDFKGDGHFDTSSFEGPNVTTTYDEPGTYTATLRVIDSGDSAVTSFVTITVLPQAVPTITMSPTPPAGLAPLTVAFNATLTGAVPTAYLWDFEGVGVFDTLSSTTAAAPFTFRSPGTFFPRLLVRDSQGRATRGIASAITVTAGPSPPSIASFSVPNGLIPYAATFSVGHSDLGATGTVEFDLDGDGRYDFITVPGSSTGTSFVAEIQRAGSFTPRVRVTDSAGRSASSTATFNSRSLGVTGWMVDPRAGDRLAGSSVTLSAQAVPGGVSKLVQFQARDALGGPWTNIGPPIRSSGTLFSTTWDVSGLADLASFDLRILMDGVASSGDTANTIVIDSAAPTISESGLVRTKTIRTDRTTNSRNAQGVWAIVPLGAASSALPLGIQPASAPMANGSALTMVPRGSAWRLDFGGTFGNAFQLRLPSSGGDAADFEIHHYDAASGVWQRLAFPRVSHDDGWVEADANAAGIYSLFAPSGTGGGGGGGGGCGATGLEAFLIPGLAFLLRRRRC
jgi:PKD repeat protein